MATREFAGAEIGGDMLARVAPGLIWDAAAVSGDFNRTISAMDWGNTLCVELTAFPSVQHTTTRSRPSR